jgi:hypothetical protein
MWPRAHIAINGSAGAATSVQVLDLSYNKLADIGELENIAAASQLTRIALRGVFTPTARAHKPWSSNRR